MQRGAFFRTSTTPGCFIWRGSATHCTYPGCLSACPRKAIYKRPEDGIVLVDRSRCRGYRECVKACPYKENFSTWSRGFRKNALAASRSSSKVNSRSASRPASEDPSARLPFEARRRKKRTIRSTTWSGSKDRAAAVSGLERSRTSTTFRRCTYPRLFLQQMFGQGVEEALKTYQVRRQTNGFGRAPDVWEYPQDHSQVQSRQRSQSVSTECRKRCAYRLRSRSLRARCSTKARRGAAQHHPKDGSAMKTTFLFPALFLLPVMTGCPSGDHETGAPSKLTGDPRHVGRRDSAC